MEAAAESNRQFNPRDRSDCHRWRLRVMSAIAILLLWAATAEAQTQPPAGRPLVSVLNASTLPIGPGTGARIGVLLSANEDNLPTLLNKRFVKAAVELAIDSVRSQGPIVGGRSLTVKYGETDRCSETLASLEAVDMFINIEAFVFIGPVCNYAIGPVSRIASEWNLPVISPGALVNYFDQKGTQDYKTLTRMQGSFSQVGRFVYAAFSAWGFEKRNYVNYALMALGNPSNVLGKSDHEFVCSAARDDIGISNSTVHQSTKVLKIVPNDSRDKIAEILKQISKTARFVVMCADKDTIRDIMIVASELGFIEKGEYVFINIDLFRSKKDNYKPWFKANDTDARNQIAKRAFESLMTITMRQPDSDEYHNFSQEVKARAAAMGRENDRSSGRSNASTPALAITPHDDEVNSFVGAYHDAVLLYAAALNESLAAGEPITNGLAITHRMWNRTFRGITGNVSIDANGDRNADYSLLDLRENENFEVVANYFGATKKYEEVQGMPIRWPNSVGPPPDTPRCGFDGSNCPKNDPFPEYAIVVIVMGSLSIIVSVAAVFIYRHYKLEAELSAMTWRIKWEEIDFDFRRSSKRTQQLDPKHEKGKKIRDNAANELEKDGLVANSKKMMLADTRSYAESEGSTDTIVQQRQMFTKAGYYKGAIVALKSIHKSKIDISKPLLMEIKRIKDLSCDHVARFVGACIDPPHHCLLTEYCQKGSLQDVLENDQINLDWTFKFSLMQDIVRGMMYIHSNIGPHGNLKSSNCVVDSRFVLKITDFGLHALRGCDPSVMADRYQYYKRKLWTAPELLRQQNPPPEGTVKGDVFSFAIVCQEIVYRNGVWYTEGIDVNPEQIIRAVKDGQKPLFRPTIDAEATETHPDLIHIVRVCWSEDPNERPDFAHVKVLFRKLNRGGDSSNILDNLLARMEQYANNLEDLVEQRTVDYMEQKKRAEELLYMMLPKSVANQLIRGEPVVAESYEKVSIYFSDICGFTDLCARSAVMDVVNLLNDLYSMFDFIIESFDVYKVETIGDAYMCVSGLPKRNGNLHAREIARMSLALLKAVQSFKIRHEPDEKLMLRIGMHSGPVCTGVVGLKMPRYCLFGDTVNTASRMESNGAPLRIHVSSTTKEILDTFGTFSLEPRGQLEIKGKGIMTTWWLNCEDEEAAAQLEPLEGQTHHTQGNILSLKNRDKPSSYAPDDSSHLSLYSTRSASTVAPPDLVKLGITPMSLRNANDRSASPPTGISSSQSGSPTRNTAADEGISMRTMSAGERDRPMSKASALKKARVQVHQKSLEEEDETSLTIADRSNRSTEKDRRPVVEHRDVTNSNDKHSNLAGEKRTVGWAVNGGRDDEQDSRKPLLDSFNSRTRFDEPNKTNSASATA